MIQTGIDLSDASVREIILAYRAYRRTLNPSFNNDHILRRVDQLEEEFSCILMPSQITDVFYANFIQWAHEKGNCYSTIKLYCNQLKSALNWASRHGCKLSQPYRSLRHLESSTSSAIQENSGESQGHVRPSMQSRPEIQ